MSEVFRETIFGHIVRWLTSNRVLQYLEERTDFQLPPDYCTSDKHAAPDANRQSTPSADSKSPETSKETEDQARDDLEGLFGSSCVSKEKICTIVWSASNDGTILVD